MKKGRVKVIPFVLVLLFSLAGLTACRGNEIVETDYFRVELNKKEEYAIVFELTDLGKEQEILAVPMYVEGLPVKQIGKYPRLNILGITKGIFSNNLSKLYIPHTVDDIKRDAIGIPSDGVVVLMHIEDDKDTIFEKNNVFFMYNFSNPPNQGYYWIDYITGSNLFMLPPSPVRENYNFAGWYLEPEFIASWNERMPQTADETLNLYAKWQEK